MKNVHFFHHKPLGFHTLKIHFLNIETSVRKFILTLLLLSSIASFAQSYKISWGNEVKMKKNTSDMDVVAADSSGVYFTEEKPRGFESVDIGVTLVKFDTNFNEVFQKDYSKELEGFSY